MSGAHGIARAALADGVPQPGNGPWTVHGVLLGENETTKGKHSPKYWPSEEQRKAAASLEDVEFSVLHESEARPVGTVTSAVYEPGVGTVYEAQVDDYATAAALSRGELGTSLEASVSSHASVGHTDEGTAYLKNYSYNRVAAVDNPASKANYNAAGPINDNPGLTAALEAGDGTVSTVVRAALGNKATNADIARKKQWVRENFGTNV